MMKSLLVAAVILPLTIMAEENSAVRIGASEARDYIGKVVTVTGIVAEVHVSEQLVRINLDKKFPQQPFTAVIFANKTNQFGNLPELKGKAVEVTGAVAEYRARPEVVLTRTNQLAVVVPEKK